MKTSFAIALAVAAVLPFSAAWGQDAAPSYKASPDVYKVLGENDQFRVIEATWKPGQKDNMHSHEGALMSYALTDCANRLVAADGKKNENPGRKAGTVLFTPAVKAHQAENIGKSACRLLIVERK